MKQYFSIDSSIFTFFALFFIIIGSPIWLLIFSVLTIIFLIFKSGIKVKTDDPNVNGIWIGLIVGGIIGPIFFGPLGLGLVLFIYWFYILIKHLNR